MDNITFSLSEYKAQFSNLTDFISKLSLNMMGNVFTLKTLGNSIMNEYLHNRNMTIIFDLLGKFTITCFQMDPSILTHSLRYTETDPLSADPFSTIYWTPLESVYEFLENSKLASEVSLDLAANATANFIIEVMNTVTYFQLNDTRNAIFAISDSMFYLHDMLQGWHDTTAETLTTLSKISFTGAQIGANLKTGWFWILSQSMGIWAESYYMDFINLSRVAGKCWYNLFVINLA